MFETISKSFKVVWNHTLNVEKVTSPEIGQILGPQKYEQVNGDITGALGIVRALLDGTGTSPSATTNLSVKAIIEEINYARSQVQRWIYSEYKTVAEVMGFNRFPKVRFDDMALRDEIHMMTILQGLADRRIVSYATIQKKLGFDPDTELAQMTEEKKLVEDGVLGIVGSPFQQSSNRQATQGAPSGTPSEGRPRGRPAVTPKPKDETQPPKASAEELEDVLSELDLDEIEDILRRIRARKKKAKK